jgi:hypothetical protein
MNKLAFYKYQHFVVRPPIEQYEKCVIIKQVLESHRLFFHSLILSNNNIDDEIKNNLLSNLDFILYSLFCFLMDDNFNENTIINFLFENDFSMTFREMFLIHNLFEPILRNGNIY